LVLLISAFHKLQGNELPYDARKIARREDDTKNSRRKTRNQTYLPDAMMTVSTSFHPLVFHRLPFDLVTLKMMDPGDSETCPHKALVQLSDMLPRALGEDSLAI
jgi:hypothetical protein